MRIIYFLSYPVILAGETGGVLHLFKSYMEMAGYLGHQVSTFSAIEQSDWTSADLVHIAPCDLSMLHIAQVLALKRMPFVISPILDKLYPDYALRMVTLGDRLIGRLYRSNLGAAQEMCKLASGICLMSAHEEQRIIKGLGVRPRFASIVPPINWRREIADEEVFRKRYGNGEFVLFAGDLGNPRKNVLRLIDATHQKGLPLVMVGQLNDTAYGRLVRQAIEKTPNTRYLGVIPRDMLSSAMKCARVLALPSLMEGIGMAAIEAGSLGTRVVITKYGGPSDYFGNLAWYVDPYSVRSIASGLVSAWNANETPQLAQSLKEKLSIAALAPKLEALYRGALE